MNYDVEALGLRSIILVVISLFFILFVLFYLMWMNWKKEGLRGDVSPYAKRPMELGIDVAKSLAALVNSFLEEMHEPHENPPIDFSLAALCPTTGRIFPNCVTKQERISLSWDFLNKRYEGNYISWGSLPEEEKAVLRILHGSIEGFQAEKSSSHVLPQNVEEEFALLSPGPLYVDRKTKILLGWKKVPGTYFEVLVVQKPKYQSLDETI
jgi:hypothetical protein